MAEACSSTVRPGIHPEFAFEHFGAVETQIIRKLANEWLVTRGSKVTLARSSYPAFLMKPTELYRQMFNIDREIVGVFSPYPSFEPRTLDAFSRMEDGLSGLRVEPVCRILVSNDPEVEAKTEALLKTDPEQPIVIPFTYAELQGSFDDYFIRNRFRKHFYTRDLFGFLSPLKTDLYFFGRSELIQEIVNRHRAGEHTGLFGLRKSGKTSIVYAIERHLASQGDAFLSVDCESPSVHMLRWNELLEKTVHDYRAAKQSKYKLNTEGRYTEKLAADSFAQDVLAIHQSKKAASVLFLFDEIERISPHTGSSAHWRDGEDFVYFWQTLRAFYQRNPNVLTYMLVGTNPSCIELATIASHENPLFGSIPGQYVPPFTVEQVRQMVRRLGRYMGLTFDELIYAKLTEDFGGHPFLIRQFCSQIHRTCAGDRPARVDKALYEKVKKGFSTTAVEYLEMVVQVLRDWYPDEYDMLRLLAQGDVSTFEQLAADHQRYTKHLVGYGLLERSDNGFSFRIEAIKELLGKIHKYESMNLTHDQKLAEVSHRRNAIERDLRVMIRKVLLANHGKQVGLTKVMAALAEPRRARLIDKSLDDLLAPGTSDLYFSELVCIIDREWNTFKNVLEMQKDECKVILDFVSREGRPDAHAKQIADETFLQLRLYFAKIERVLVDWS